MPRIRDLHTNFAGGELDPRMKARSDTRMYQSGASDLQNNGPLIEGGVERRPGWKFLANLGSISNASRMIMFRFNDDQEYIFFFENTKVTIYLPTGVLATTLTSCPWTTAMLSQLRFAQAGDTMIVVHEDMPVDRILRTGASTFTRAAFAFEKNLEDDEFHQPYFRYAVASLYITPSALTGSITLTASAAFFTAAYVGERIRLVYIIEDSVNDDLVERFYEALITAYSSSTVVTATLKEDIPSWGDIKGTTSTWAVDNRRQYEAMPWWSSPADGDPIPTEDWDEPAFSAIRGYPRSVAFHGPRLWFGGSKSLPGQMWGSKVSAFFNFEPGAGTDADAISQPIEAGVAHKIRHLVSHSHLLIFCDLGEFYAPETQVKPITPGNFGPKRQTGYGCNNVVPMVFDQASIFVQDNDATVREYRFDDVAQSYLAPAISVIASTMCSSIVDMAICVGNETRPEQFAALVNGDGTLAIFHASRDQQIAAWLPWDTDGLVKQAAGFGTDLYLMIERTINSATVLFLEKMDRTKTLDASMSKTIGSLGTSFSGFTHLASQEVDVISGNNYVGKLTVSSGGVITTADEFLTIDAGLDYTRKIKTLPADFALAEGTAIGQLKRVVKVIIKVFESIDIIVDGQRAWIRNVGDDLSVAPTAQTGDYEFSLLGWDRDGQAEIVQELPLPLTVLGMVLEIEM